MRQATGIIKIHDEDFLRRALFRLDEFSHLWLVFWFHETGSKDWKPSIRPPRLGGKERVGVLASRSPHRPNPLGLSVVKLEKVDLSAEGGPEIHVSGVDLLDQTPIVDIKPYIAYADIVENSVSGWADEKPTSVPVQFSDEALVQLGEMSRYRERGGSSAQATEPVSDLRLLIEGILTQDPRPAAQKTKFAFGDPESIGKQFGFTLYDWDIRWQIASAGFLVTEVIRMGTKPKVKSSDAQK